MESRTRNQDYHAKGWLTQKARLKAEEKMAAKARKQQRHYLNKASNYKRKANELQKQK